MPVKTREGKWIAPVICQSRPAGSGRPRALNQDGRPGASALWNTAALPVPLPSAKMAAVEKRRPAAAPAASFSDSGRPAAPRAAAAAESEEDFLRQVGATEMLRAALLKVLEARPEEPIAFLAHYFENMGLRSPANGGAGEPPGQLLLQQQRLGRALWHLRLAHHSQRCGAGPGGAAADPARQPAARGRAGPCAARPPARAPRDRGWGRGAPVVLAGFVCCDAFPQTLSSPCSPPTF